MAGNVSRLIYISTAKSGVTKKDVENILATARRVNAERGITGMLLYDSTSFMQLLEGPQDNVSKTFDEICRDGRHHNVVLIMRQTGVPRQFPNWTMGYSLLDDPRILQGEGWFPLTLSQLEKSLPAAIDPDIRVLFTSFLSVRLKESA
ncbi:BLUF domain-containing protein [Hyphobacterium sp.]|jgi:hypothetical protein|uniref:BLUF domain-containing protein n=1 Tax=Hyphobacterium sp. TaxID=2004662 RepID=UPI003BAA8763